MEHTLFLADLGIPEPERFGAVCSPPDVPVVDVGKLICGFGFLLIVVAIGGYLVGRLQLPEHGLGEITVRTTPSGATIFVDGLHRGSSPVRVSGLRPGTHQLRAVMPGYRGVILSVEVLPSANDSLDWMLEPSLSGALYKQLAVGFGAHLPRLLSAGDSETQRWSPLRMLLPSC